MASALALNFDEWVLRFKKRYSTEVEKERRRMIWSENVRAIEAHNAAAATYVLKMNQFGDMTPIEFREKVLMRPLIPTSSARNSPALTSAPAAFDWRNSEQLIVTSVKDQGFVGTCWSFSTIGNVESVWAIQTKQNAVSLAPEFLVDCDGSADEAAKHADCSVFGGWPYLAYQYLIDRGGVPSESAYPYCAGTGECYPCMEGPVQLCGPPPYTCERERTQTCQTWTSFTSKISDWFQVDASEPAVTSALASTAPLSVLLDASGLQFYKSGVYNPRACSATELNHAVLLVGYNATTDGAYYSVKNSWSNSWGEDGYFRISREVGDTGPGTCGIQTSVTSAIA